MFCVLQKKVLSFGPNRTVEVWPNSSAEPKLQSVFTSNVVGLIQKDRKNETFVILHPNLFQKVLCITKVGQAGNMAGRENSNRQASKTLKYVPEDTI